tara:strand:+ start:7155 stop:8147 length:993 start_codon:yes stop_codon:yes gene_type:complete
MCHIARAIEYEKIVPFEGNKPIEVTRQRMAVQQLLDTRENDTTLVTRLQNYIKNFDMLKNRLNPHQKLKSQPLFEWTVGSETLKSCCWRLEAIIPRFALTQLYTQQANEAITNKAFKDAAKIYDKVIHLHKCILYELEGWSWKLAHMNHDILQKPWHYAQIFHIQSLKHLCMLSLGIQNQTSSNAMYIVAQRAVRDAAAAIMHWPMETSTLPLAETMRYYYSSDILWNKEQYGASIHTLETWLTQTNSNVGQFHIIAEEMEKIPLLLRERHQSNNGAYFDIVKEGPALPTPQELIHMATSDVPHPQCSPQLTTEHAQDEEHAFQSCDGDA